MISRSYVIYLYMVLLQHCFRSGQHCFLLEQTVFNVLQTFQTDWVDSSTQSSLVIQNSCSIDYPVFCHLPSSFRTLISLSFYLWSLCTRIIRPPSDAAFPSLIPSISRAGHSHHRLDRRSPVFRYSDIYKSIIGRVTMYCETMFWCNSIYTPIYYSPTIANAAPMGLYTHFPSR